MRCLSLNVSDHETVVIEGFCRRINQIEGVPVRVLSRPDRENPGKSGCDAIIERGNERCALEHTTIHGYHDQQQDSARFRRVIVPLEESVGAALPDEYIEIAIHSRAIPTGTDWDEIQEALDRGLKALIPTLPMSTRSRRHELPGVPFPVSIVRHEPGYQPGCFVSRFSPEDGDREISSQWERIVADKTKQLTPYRSEGLTTILLVEQSDVALLNNKLVAEGFARTMDDSNGVAFDEVYIADTEREPLWIYPIKLGNRRFPDLPEFRQYFHAQYSLKYNG